MIVCCDTKLYEVRMLEYFKRLNPGSFNFDIFLSKAQAFYNNLSICVF